MRCEELHRPFCVPAQFTRGPVLSSVAAGTDIEIRSNSSWNRPEPEVVLVCDNSRKPRVAALRQRRQSARHRGPQRLIAGQSQGQHDSCAIRPFIRLFDRDYSLNDLRGCTVHSRCGARTASSCKGESSLNQVGRDPLELVAQTVRAHHQYPDGFALFLGTRFAPVEDQATVLPTRSATSCASSVLGWAR